ncbi:MAG: hypothetical protein RI981_507 [Bacteroidota bacterium]|jgi:hypothetical protein
MGIDTVLCYSRFINLFIKECFSDEIYGKMVENQETCIGSR